MSDLADLPQSANGHHSSYLQKSVSNSDDKPRRPPHNIDAEQWLLGTILVNNELHDRVSGILLPRHFFDPVHASIYDVATKLIIAGRQANPITLKSFFEAAEPIKPDLTVPHYLRLLVRYATTIANAVSYAREIVEHSERRQIIQVTEELADGAYDAPADLSPHRQLAEHRSRIETLLAQSVTIPSGPPLAGVEPRNIDWLWPRRIPRGKVSLVAGQPGRGKSQLSLHMAAQVSNGGKWPDGARCPQGSVVIVSCEDDVTDTIVPRLIAAGADLSRCYDHSLTDLSRDTPALVARLRALQDVALLIIDPATAYLGKFDGNNAPEVRRLLAPLQKMAADLNVAVLLVTHLNKSTANGEPMSRVAGSGAFVAVCRSAWLVETDPDDTERRRRLFVPLKNNIGDDITGFAFKVESAIVNGTIETSRVVFEPGTITASAADILGGQRDNAEDVGALGDARDFLRDLLKEGPIMAKSAQKAADEAGISKRTLARARKDLRVRSTKSGVTGSWVLSLPDAQECQGSQECQSLGADTAGILGTELGADTEDCQALRTGNLGTLGTVGSLDNDSIPF